MKMLILLLILTACAPMPGNKLFNGLTEPTPLNQVKITETIDFWETQKFCHTKLWEDNQELLSLFICVTNFCILPACCWVEMHEGKVTEAQIYLSWDINYWREHELKHAEGRTDVWY